MTIFTSYCACVDANFSDDRNKNRLVEIRLNALFCHFSLRTPRFQLHHIVTGGNDKLALGDKLSQYMQDEDCQYGLNVINERKDKWTAYGDKMLRNTLNQRNLQFALEAVQTSANQVYDAFKSPNKVIEPRAVTQLIPKVDPTAKNNVPLFRMSKDCFLLRRKDVKNLQDQNTVINWWGTTTMSHLAVANKKGTSALPEP